LYIFPKELFVWKSLLFDANESANNISVLFQKEANPIQIDINTLSFELINVQANSIITLTTITTGHKGSYPKPPNKEKFPLPYFDNFEMYQNEKQPKFFSDQAGSFSIQNKLLNNNTNDTNTTNQAFTQVVPYSPSANNTGWHNKDAPQPLTIIGDYNLSNYNLSVSAFMISNNGVSDSDSAWDTSNVMIAVRLGGNLSTSGCKGNPRENRCVEAKGSNWFLYGYFLQIDDNGYWKLMPGSDNPILIDGNLNLDLRQRWFNLSLSISPGFSLSATFNQIVLFKHVVDQQNRFVSGWAGLSCGWQTCQFDNFVLK
jgi:hypothetical protein